MSEQSPAPVFADINEENPINRPLCSEEIERIQHSEQRMSFAGEALNRHPFPTSGYTKFNSNDDTEGEPA